MKTAEELFDEIHDNEAYYFLQTYNMQSFNILREKIIKLLKESLPVEAGVKPANGDFYYLRNKQNNKIYQIDSYAAKFTSLCYPDIEGIYKSILGEDYYLLDECGRCDRINTENWDIIMISQNDYRCKVLNNEFEK